VDPFDPKLDIRSFRLGQVAFNHYSVTVPPNRSFFQTRLPLSDQASNIVADIGVGVDVTTGKATWTLTAIDLNTGAEPVDPNFGLLPPDVTNSVGEGYVTYTIKPVAGLPTGTVITNQAVITFENNAPINTPIATNTLDALPPSSRVAALPAVVSSTNIPVRWSGTDDANGSGVQSFNVFASDNGGPYSLWFSTAASTNGTVVTNSVYVGQPGHTYGFYSLATDYSGNMERAHASADATVLVSGNQAPVVAPVPDQVVNVGSLLSIVDNVINPGQAGAMIGVSLLGAPPGVVAGVSGTNIFVNWQPSFFQAGTTNILQLIITNNGAPPLVTTQTFLVSVPDFVQIGIGSIAGRPGQAVCLPMSLFTSTALTNLQFIVDVPSTGLTNWSVQLLSPKLCGGTVKTLNASQLLVNLSACAGQSLLVSGQVIADLCLNVETNQHSELFPIPIGVVQASRTDSTQVADVAASNGSLIVIGDKPYLEIRSAGTNGVTITLYGLLNVTNTLQATPTLAATNSWKPIWQGLVTNLVTPINFPTTNNILLFRAVAP
jgi:hypothetical protein